MAHDRSEVHLAADLDGAPAHEIAPGVFRLAIAGDFSGGKGVPVAQRRPVRVDRDDLDDVLSRVAPTLRLALDPGEPPLEIRFASLDDFHPDRLIARLPIFQRLVALRDQAGHAPSSPRPAAPPRASERPDSVALDLSGGSLLDRIVGADAPANVRQAPPRDDLADFVSRAVHSHLVSEPTAEQRDLRAKVDDVIAATLRVVLHLPSFQALEALWRGVDFIVRRLDTSETMQVFLIDLSRDELVGDLASANPSRSAAGRLLGGGWSVVAGAYTFEPSDARTLASLAALARSGGAPVIAAAHPRFVGVDSFAGADPDDWSLASDDEWRSLRASPAASFLSLAVPRFLLRAPFGKRGEQCETFALEELGAGTPDHESFLWGNPALACALAVAGAVESGRPPTSRAVIDGLPLYVAPVDGEMTATPVVEMVTTPRAVETLLDAGLTVLVSPRDADEVVIPRVQSIAAPARPLSIRETSV